MDEDQMWKGFYNKLQELRINPPTEHEQQLRDADNGFFEKFGSLLRQKSTIDENNYKPVEEDCTVQKTSNECYSEKELDTTSDVSDYVISSAEGSQQDIFSESLKVTFPDISFCMNIEDLYEEILFEIYNYIGFSSTEVSADHLVEFAQDVFKIANSTHSDIVEIAKKKQPPNIRLNVEVIKAEKLVSKDSNGLSDPFVTLYLKSKNTHRYNSSVKTCTLNPIWEEHFSLPITESLNEEDLIIEVWDFDAAETVKEKVNKFFEVKGVRGLSKLMKEIAVTASSGKHDNEIIGRAIIPLKSIPATGLTLWYNLEKGNKTKTRGSVLVNITLSAEKNKNVARQEHKHLLKMLLLHELDTSAASNYWWSGTFSANAEAIRTQHAAQSGLSAFDCALSQWHAYSTVHETHRLSFVLFNSILDILLPTINCLQNESDDVKTFWDGAKRLLPSCFSVLRKLRSKTVSDNKILKALNDVLDILAKIKTFEIPVTVELFPKTVYGWIEMGESKDYNIDDAIVDAINSGAKEWLEHILDAGKQSQGTETDESNLQYLIKIVQMIRSDLQRAMEYFDKIFYHKVKINYSSILFLFYDSKLMEISKTIVTKVCANIQMLDVPDDQFEYLPNIDGLDMGTTLFEAYLILKRYNILGRSLCPNEKLGMYDYYQWFERSVTHWLDISIIKALNRVQKAIDLDKLKAVDETVKYSSSAVDTLAIFYQIKIFWQQLDWPEIESSYTFVAKIVNDICRCCIFYAQRMTRRVENITKTNQDGEMFTLSEEWCLAINNMDYIRQSLPSFLKELGTDDLIKRIGEFRSNLEAERCANTIKAVIDNAIDTLRNQIVELTEHVAKKMSPSIRRFLTEGAEVLHKDSNSMETLMMYLEGSLTTLYDTLNEVNFARVLDGIWAELSIILYDLIQSNLDKRRPPAFFKNLRGALNAMVSSFAIGNTDSSDNPILLEIEKTLDLHALETSDLIHQYYVDRFRFQKEQTTSPFGQLTISAEFSDAGLLLMILNARNLIAMDSNGLCDSFVKVTIMPTERFNGITPVKTAVHNKNCFPLYDEKFSFHLSAEQRQKHDSLILFSVKDKDLFGISSQYIAECYVSFEDLKACQGEQILMNLSRPEYTDCQAIRALEYRQGDKQAKEFLKKLKNKSYS